jgi:glycosyltransferase involved in cell wall biosynthesis
MTGMTTNAIDLFEGLRLCEGVSPVLMVGKPDNIEVVGSNRFYSKYLSDSDVVFYKSCVSSPFQVLKTTIRVIELLVQGRYDLVHCESPYYTYIPWLCGKKFLSTMHVTDIYPKLYFKRGSHCISISKETTRWAIDVCRFKPQQVTMVTHGVSTRFACPLDERERKGVMQQYGIPRAKIYIGLVGSIEPRKGHDVLLRAIAGLPSEMRQQIHILFVGSDKDEDQRSQRWLDGLVKETGLGNRITQIKYCDPYPLYKSMDILVLPSRQEGFPLTAIEGMMSGTCVVRSNCEGADLQITDGVDGRLFKVDDVEGLRNILAELINNTENRQTMACAGQKKALQEFSTERMAKDVYAVYKRLLSK